MKRLSLTLTLYALGCFAVGLLALSCGGVDCKDPAHAKDIGCIASSTISDCTGGSAAGAVAKYGPEVEDLIAKTPRLPDGSVDWATIQGRLEKNVADAGMCVLAEVFSKYIFNTSPFTGQGTPPPAADDARREFDKLRAEHAPGVTFKTSHGTITP